MCWRERVSASKADRERKTHSKRERGRVERERQCGERGNLKREAVREVERDIY
jgi:hypothetical protein